MKAVMMGYCYLQVLSDQILGTLLHRVILNDLLQRRRQFRTTDSTIVKNNKLSKRLNYFHLFLRFFAFLCSIAVLYSIAFSFYSHQFIIPVWYSEEYPLLYNCLFYIQWVLLTYIALFEYGCICFFNSLYVEVADQFELLNSITHETLNDFIKKEQKGTSQKLRELVDYHQLLIRSAKIYKRFALRFANMNFSYTQDIGKVNSLRLLNMLAIVALVICIELYTISSK